MIASDPKLRRIGFGIFGKSIKLILSRLVRCMKFKNKNRILSGKSNDFEICSKRETYSFIFKD